MLALLAPAAKAIPALALAACAATLVTAVAVTDRLPWLPHPAEPGPAELPNGLVTSHDAAAGNVSTRRYRR